jgi:hypothetical protein
METGMKFATSSIAVAALLAGGGVVAQTQPTPAPAAQVEPDAAVTAEEARRTAIELAAMVEDGYVFPDVARRYAAALRTKAESGAYDSLGTAGALADQLSADLRGVSPDNHLRVMVGRPAMGGGPRRVLVRRPTGPGAAPQPADAPRPMAMLPSNPIEEARWLAPGIAYIRFTLFPGAPETVEAARKFMADHAEAKTIIFDIRTHRGGGLAEMDAMFPYLFAREAALVRMDTRASVERANGSPIAGLPSLRVIPTGEDVIRREHFVTPHASEKRLFDAQVYVLTSNFTGSAAEHFALALKRTKRATLVGEATGGAGHYGGIRPIGDKFSVFIPVGRTFDPDTDKGWEGDGVPPDITVPAERALIEALVRSGVAQAEAEKLSAEVHPEGPMTRPERRAS